MFYFKSRDIKVFPCTYRGNYTTAAADGSDISTIFDPEARLQSEFNLTHLGRQGAQNSYIIEINDSILKCNILGYYFEINLTNTYKNILIPAKSATGENTYNPYSLYIKLVPQTLASYDTSELDSTRESQILGNILANSDYSLDQQKGDAGTESSTDTDYYFYGIVAATDDDVLKPEGKLYNKVNLNSKLQITVATSDTNSNALGAWNYEAFLPSISAGSHVNKRAIKNGNAKEASGENSIAAGNGTIASENDLTVVGTYNTKATSGDLFIVGNGTSDSSRSNIFVVNNNKDGTLKVAAVPSSGDLALNKRGFVVGSKAGSNQISTFISGSNDISYYIDDATLGKIVGSGTSLVDPNATTGYLLAKGHLAITRGDLDTRPTTSLDSEEIQSSAIDIKESSSTKGQRIPSQIYINREGGNVNILTGHVPYGGSSSAGYNKQYSVNIGTAANALTGNTLPVKVNVDGEVNINGGTILQNQNDASYPLTLVGNKSMREESSIKFQDSNGADKWIVGYNAGAPDPADDRFGFWDPDQHKDVVSISKTGGISAIGSISAGALNVSTMNGFPAQPDCRKIVGNYFWYSAKNSEANQKTYGSMQFTYFGNGTGMLSFTCRFRPVETGEGKEGIGYDTPKRTSPTETEGGLWDVIDGTNFKNAWDALCNPDSDYPEPTFKDFEVDWANTRKNWDSTGTWYILDRNTSGSQAAALYNYAPVCRVQRSGGNLTGIRLDRAYFDNNKEHKVIHNSWSYPTVVDNINDPDRSLLVLNNIFVKLKKKS